jgi:hypothetical protein
VTRRVRVVVVLDDVRGTVHGMTTSNDEARQWCRELDAKYPDRPLCARQFVGVVDVVDGTWWDN